MKNSTIFSNLFSAKHTNVYMIIFIVLAFLVADIIWWQGQNTEFDIEITALSMMVVTATSMDIRFAERAVGYEIDYVDSQTELLFELIDEDLDQL